MVLAEAGHDVDDPGEGSELRRRRHREGPARDQVVERRAEEAARLRAARPRRRAPHLPVEHRATPSPASSGTCRGCPRRSAAARSTGGRAPRGSGTSTSGRPSLLGPFPGADVVDWPFSYDEISPVYDEIERLIGVQGDIDQLPAEPTLAHAPRARALPMPPGPRSALVPARRRGLSEARLPPVPRPDRHQQPPLRRPAGVQRLRVLRRVRLPDPRSGGRARTTAPGGGRGRDAACRGRGRGGASIGADGRPA